MAIDVVFGNDDATDVLRQRVFTREKWTADWELQPAVHCVSCTWSASPSISEAIIYYRYGAGRLPSDEQIQHYKPFTLPNLGFVKVEFEVFDRNGNVQIISWVGVVGLIVDRAEGGQVTYRESDPVASGYQQFNCVGMEWLLDRHYILAAPIRDKMTGIGHAPAFGRNRLDSDDLVFDRRTSYDESGEPWSSRNVVEHLLKYQTPVDGNGDIKIPFEIENANLLPDWDEVYMEQHGYTTMSLLRQLVARQRGLGFFVAVNRKNKVRFVIFSFTDQSISLGQGNTLPKNPLDHYNIQMSSDRTGSSTFITDAFSQFDRVRVIGERATMTFSVTELQPINQEDFSSAIDDAVNGINAKDTEAKTEALSRILSTPRIIDAVSQLAVKADSIINLTQRPAADGTSFEAEITYLEDKFILPRTRLRVDGNYSGDSFPSDNPDPDLPSQYYRPFVLIKADDDTYVDITQYGVSVRDERNFNASVTPSAETFLAVDVNYTGNTLLLTTGDLCWSVPGF